MAKHIWRCNDGREVLVEEMDDMHLLNTVAFLRRWKRHKMAGNLYDIMAYMNSDPPDGAAQAAEVEFNHYMRLLFEVEEYESDMHDMDFDEAVAQDVPIFKELIVEMKKRGLKPIEKDVHSARIYKELIKKGFI